MLIKIDESLTNNFTDDILEALRYLAIAAKEGKHKVVAKRKTLEKIMKCPRLSEYERSIYQKLHHASAELLSNLNAVSKYIEVVDSCHEPKLENLAGKSIIKVPVKFFNDTTKIQSTILLCENSEDTKFYIKVARVYCLWKNLKKIPLKYTSRGGGGSTISREYENIQNYQENLCLCLIDSDRLSPHSSVGKTAQAIQEIDDENILTTQLVILNFREIENLIPNSILSELCQNNLDRERSLKLLEVISSSNVAKSRDFLDMKDGSKFYTIANASDSSVKKFWEPLLKEYPTVFPPLNKLCLEDWRCQEKIFNQKAECKCDLFYGFGTHILRDTIRCLEKENDHKIAPRVDDRSRAEWEYIGQNIVDWCFAGSRIQA
jgi:hypothetical protein